MRTGIDERTGKMLQGWPHCQQSIRRCLRLRFRTRAMRYHLASDIRELQDANADAATIFAAIVAIAEALADPDGGEPGFGLKEVEVVVVGRTGRAVFLLSGAYYPRGHLGDFSIRENQTVTWPEVDVA